MTRSPALWFAALAVSGAPARAEAPADFDKDGVPDTVDWCPTAVESKNGVDDDDGCPDGRTEAVVVSAGKVELLEKVQFQTGTATILKQSTPLLEKVAAALKDNPQLLKVRIEGHTDQVGAEEKNLELSKQRAQAVRADMIARGIAPERMEFEGYGSSRPIASNDTEDGRALNRRVEFSTLEMGKEPPRPAGAVQQATLSTSHGPVRVNQPNGLKGRGVIGMSLPNATEVTTGPDGHADIALPSSSRLQVLPSTEVKVWTKVDDVGPASLARLSLGSIWASVQKAANGLTRFDVKTPNATASAKGAEFIVNVIDDDAAGLVTQVGAVNGEVEVTSGGQAVKVPQGQGTRSVADQAPEPPRALPTAPLGLSPWEGDFTGSVELTWTPVPNARYRVQISRDVAFQALVVSKVVGDARFRFTPEYPGDFFWRVRSLSAGLESTPSQLFRLTAKAP